MNTCSSVNTLQTATAAFEAGAGLALLCFPSVAVALLLGVPLETPASLAVARVGGAALLTLGVAVLISRGDTQSASARGLGTPMAGYNLLLAPFFVAAPVLTQPA